MLRIGAIALASAVGAALLLGAVVSTGTIAQPTPPAPAPAKAPKTTPKATAAPAPAQPQPPQPQMPIEQVLYLVRSTLLTLNDANRSGNYTVLRDLAASEFQARNTAADLAHAFSDLRRRNFDLYGAALLAPQLATPPSIDQDGRLRLSGVFPTRPLQIAFDLVFVVSAGQWKLFGIAINTPEAPPLDAQAKPDPRKENATAPKSTTGPAEPARRIQR